MREEDVNDGLAHRLLTGWPRDTRMAAAFLLRLPIRVPADAWEGGLTTAARAFPLIGAAVGLAGGLVLMLAAKSDLAPLGCALLALGLQALLTGGLHEDGLADVADGIGGGADPARRLEIMRDSRIGAFGVLALVFVIGVKAAALSSLMGPGFGVAALVAAGAFSRGLMPVAMNLMRPARIDGLGAGAGKPEAHAVWTALGLGVVGLFLLLSASQAFAAILLCLIFCGALSALAHRRLGGYTGDVLGALQQIAETAVLIAAAGWQY